MEHSGIASPSTIHAPFRARDDASGSIPDGLLGGSPPPAPRHGERGGWEEDSRRFAGRLEPPPNQERRAIYRRAAHTGLRAALRARAF